MGGGGLLLETLAEWHDAISTLGDYDIDVYLQEGSLVEEDRLVCKEEEEVVKLVSKVSEESDSSVSDGMSSSFDGSQSSTPSKEAKQQELILDFTGENQGHKKSDSFAVSSFRTPQSLFFPSMCCSL